MLQDKLLRSWGLLKPTAFIATFVTPKPPWRLESPGRLVDLDRLRPAGEVRAKPDPEQGEAQQRRQDPAVARRGPKDRGVRLQGVRGDVHGGALR